MNSWVCYGTYFNALMEVKINTVYAVQNLWKLSVALNETSLQLKSKRLSLFLYKQDFINLKQIGFLVFVFGRVECMIYMTKNLSIWQIIHPKMLNSVEYLQIKIIKLFG